MKKTTLKIIDNRESLEQFANQLANEPIIAVDLEADSMHHYQERVCLIQLATQTNNYIIDPLSIEDLSALGPIFEDEKIRKVFHGADYDIRSLYRDFSFQIHNLFDTQIACRFLGYQETGLDAVVTRHFGISLDKRFQKKDWSIRPLPQEMLTYAAEDVVFLIPLANELEQRLKECNRVQWVMEECNLLSGVRPETNNGDPFYLKFKGAGTMNRRQLAVLEQLLKVRDQIAEKKNRPPFKVLSNKSLATIAMYHPVSLTKLKQLHALSVKQYNMYGKLLVEAIQEAMKIPVNQLPVYPRKKSKRIPAWVPERVKELRKWRDHTAESLHLDPAVLLTKQQLTAIAMANPANRQQLQAIPSIKSWQVEAFGDPILTILKTRRLTEQTAKKQKRHRRKKNGNPN